MEEKEPNKHPHFVDEVVETPQKPIDGHYVRNQLYVRHPISAITSPALFLGGIVAYIIVGCVFRENNVGWIVGWTLILHGMAIASLITAIETKRFCAFSIILTVTAWYVGMGLLGNCLQWNPGAWHPWWAFYGLVPLYYYFGAKLDHRIHRPQPMAGAPDQRKEE